MYSYTPNKKYIFHFYTEMDRHFDVIVECKVSKVISQERLTKYICKTFCPRPSPSTINYTQKQQLIKNFQKLLRSLSLILFLLTFLSHAPTLLNLFY